MDVPQEDYECIYVIIGIILLTWNQANLYQQIIRTGVLLGHE